MKSVHALYAASVAFVFLYSCDQSSTSSHKVSSSEPAIYASSVNERNTSSTSDNPSNSNLSVQATSLESNAAFSSGTCANILGYGASPGLDDNTSPIQKALDENDCVYLPSGVYFISQAEGLKFKPSQMIRGDGPESTLLVAKDSSEGSVLKRIPLQKRGQYVTGVTIQDLGIILNPKRFTVDRTKDRENPHQVGINFHSVSGSLIQNVYVGSLVPLKYRGMFVKDLKWAQKDSFYSLVQGIGILLCTDNPRSSTSLYSGGERNKVYNSKIWGAGIGISIDHEDLCPDSEAHASILRDNDIQHVQYGIKQESKLTAGVMTSGNVIQDLQVPVSKISSENETAAIVFSGRTSTIGPESYFEAYTTEDKPLRAVVMKSSSQGNRVDLSWVGFGKFVGSGNDKKMLGISMKDAVVDQGKGNCIQGYSWPSPVGWQSKKNGC